MVLSGKLGRWAVGSWSGCRHSLRRVDSALRRHAMGLASAVGAEAVRGADVVLCCVDCGLLVLTVSDSPLVAEARRFPMLASMPCCG